MVFANKCRENESSFCCSNFVGRRNATWQELDAQISKSPLKDQTKLVTIYGCLRQNWEARR